MSDEPMGLYKLGGAAFIISGILFLSRDVLEFMADPPPSTRVQILASVQSVRCSSSTDASSIRSMASESIRPPSRNSSWPSSSTVFFAAWFVAVGSRLYSMRQRSRATLSRALFERVTGCLVVR